MNINFQWISVPKSLILNYGNYLGLTGIGLFAFLLSKADTNYKVTIETKDLEDLGISVYVFKKSLLDLLDLGLIKTISQSKNQKFQILYDLKKVPSKLP